MKKVIYIIVAVLLFWGCRGKEKTKYPSHIVYDYSYVTYGLSASPFESHAEIEKKGDTYRFAYYSDNDDNERVDLVVKADDVTFDGDAIIIDDYHTRYFITKNVLVGSRGGYLIVALNKDIVK